MYIYVMTEAGLKRRVADPGVKVGSGSGFLKYGRIWTQFFKQISD